MTHRVPLDSEEETKPHLLGGTLGIDPGKTGALAYVTGTAIRIWKMPETEQAIWELFRSIRANYAPRTAVLEFVRSHPAMGLKSIFTFGWGYGGLRMALTGNGIRFEEVTPAKWQRALGCLTKGDKSITHRRALELWPDVRITKASADAALIAEYGRRFIP